MAKNISKCSIVTEPFCRHPGPYGPPRPIYVSYIGNNGGCSLPDNCGLFHLPTGLGIPVVHFRPPSLPSVDLASPSVYPRQHGWQTSYFCHPWAEVTLRPVRLLPNGALCPPRQMPVFPEVTFPPRDRGGRPIGGEPPYLRAPQSSRQVCCLLERRSFLWELVSCELFFRIQRGFISVFLPQNLFTHSSFLFDDFYIY